MKKIAVLTSGGDAPGMNACIRAVVRKAQKEGIAVVGIKRGYQGLIDGNFVPLDYHSVSNIIQKGGTILKSARSTDFMEKEGRNKAFEFIQKQGIEALVVIGGDGTFTGAKIFEEEFGLPIMGAPGTIDNDLYGTDATIGYDTALNTIVSAVDKIRDTADSHNRLFFVEVMGKDVGFIALRSGIAIGAEAVLVPETETNIEAIANMLHNRTKDTSAIIIVAEGDEAGGAFEVAKKVKLQFDGYDTRVSILGHLQRGGSPSAFDRVLASELGVACVGALLSGKSGSMAGVQGKQVVLTPFGKAVKHHKALNPVLVTLLDVLA
ncbi:MAG: 6-phosphofructokinase 1 [Flavobacteriales bacterium]|jgi:6-phosphofructokinase 1